MISPTIQSLLINQISMEQSASQAYTVFANCFLFDALDGFYEWATKQSSEELTHAQKIIDYLNLHFTKIESLKEIPEYSINETLSLIDYLEMIYNLEHSVTLSISNIMKVAVAENDFATQDFLNCFVDEQIKAEFEITNIINKIKYANNNQAAILIIDKELKHKAHESFQVNIRG